MSLMSGGGGAPRKSRVQATSQAGYFVGERLSSEICRRVSFMVWVVLSQSHDSNSLWARDILVELAVISEILLNFVRI